MASPPMPQLPRRGPRVPESCLAVGASRTTEMINEIAADAPPLRTALPDIPRPSNVSTANMSSVLNTLERNDMIARARSAMASSTLSSNELAGHVAQVAARRAAIRVAPTHGGSSGLDAVGRGVRDASATGWRLGRRIEDGVMGDRRGELRDLVLLAYPVDDQWSAMTTAGIQDALIS